MMVSRRGVIRALITCTVFLAAIGASATANASAAATKSYSSSQLRFKLSYPATWTLQPSTKTADTMGPAEAKVSPTCLMITSPDRHAEFNVLVQRSGATAAHIKASEAAFLKEGSNLVGAIKFSTGTEAGMNLIAASATDKIDAKHNAQGLIVAGSDGRLTWFAGMAYVEGYSASSQEYTALQAIMSSFTPTK